MTIKLKSLEQRLFRRGGGEPITNPDEPPEGRYGEPMRTEFIQAAKLGMLTRWPSANDAFGELFRIYAEGGPDAPWVLKDHKDAEVAR